MWQAHMRYWLKRAFIISVHWQIIVANRINEDRWLIDWKENFPNCNSRMKSEQQSKATTHLEQSFNQNRILFSICTDEGHSV